MRIYNINYNNIKNKKLEDTNKNTTTNKQIDNNIDKRTNLINGKNNKRSLKINYCYLES